MVPTVVNFADRDISEQWELAAVQNDLVYCSSVYSSTGLDGVLPAALPPTRAPQRHIKGRLQPQQGYLSYSYKAGHCVIVSVKI